MEGGEEEEEEERKQNNNNNNNNISKSEKQEEKKNSEEMDDECESSPLQSPLHTLDDDDDDDDHHKPSSIKKEKSFFHRPLPPQLLHPPLPQPQPRPQQQRQLPPPPYLDPQPQPQPQPQRQPPPPPPYLNPPQPQRQPPPPNQSTAISIMNHPNQSTTTTAMVVSVDRKPYRFSPVRSPPLEKMNLPHTVPPPPSETVTTQSPVFVVNRPIQEELSSGVSKKMDSNGGDVEDGGGNRKPKAAALPSVLSRQRKEDMLKRAALGFRVCAVVFCLVSFSVMAADKTQGWAGDSFDRYKEYRYCISVTIIGFVYAGFQAFDLAYNLITEKHIIPYYIRYYFDFSMDQILTYLLISASSSAATRVDDWQTNWGKDEFTIMASASVGMSFMAFVAFAFSSLISGYNLCMRNYNN